MRLKVLREIHRSYFLVPLICCSYRPYYELPQKSHVISTPLKAPFVRSPEPLEAFHLAREVVADSLLNRNAAIIFEPPINTRSP